MAQADTARALVRFTRPTRQIALMGGICLLVALGGIWVFPMVKPVFLSNPYLNGTIALVFLVGVLACFGQVLSLFSSVRWLEAAASGAADTGDAPQLLAPVAAALRGGGRRMTLSTMSMRSVLDSVGSRMEESRDITRYLANLLIFLGLLGTFFGLATTVPAVVETIKSLQPTEGEEAMAVFGRLMTGLESQLGGMGTAFASSLLGLAGSLVVGLLELFSGHGQNRFYREMEEYLSTITRVSLASGEGDAGGGVDRAAVATVLDHMVDQIDTLQNLFNRAETRRAELEARMGEMTQAVSALVARITPQSEDIATRQMLASERLVDLIAGLDGSGQFDAEAKSRLRSIDVQLLQIFEKLTVQDAEETRALRRELAALNATLRQEGQSGPDRA